MPDYISRLHFRIIYCSPVTIFPPFIFNALNIALGQDRVTDHRISASVIGVERVLNGEYLQNIIEQLVQNEEKERVNLFTAELISKPIKKF